MTELIINRARAYIYNGDWIAECPRGADCNNAEYLFTPIHRGAPRTVRKPFYACSHCGLEADIDWPPESFMLAAMEVLMKRPVPGNRNWYPKDHDVAVRHRKPHGQTVEQLRDENAEHGVNP